MIDRGTVLNRFFYDGRDLRFGLEHDYKPEVIALALVITCLSFYASLSVAGHMRSAETVAARRAWLVGSALILGLGGWAMHFLGLLALELPLAVRYGFALTALSVIPSVLTNGFLVLNSSQPETKRFSPYVLTALISFGIGFMHYTGMLAIQGVDSQLILLLDPLRVAVSVIVAVVLSYGIVQLYLHVGGLEERTRWKKLRAAVLAGVGLFSIHSVAMHANYFFLGDTAPSEESFGIDQASLTLWVSLASVFIASLAIILAVLEQKRFRDLEKIYIKQIEEERARSERLLLNVIPQPIANRLKAGEYPIVDTFDEVTVLFADLVGFTQLSAQVAPSQLVTLLDQIFSAFDELADRHGLEKIKTIGDAYMAVAGLPFPRQDHAAEAANMALEMHVVIKKLNQCWRRDTAIRIGLCTGPVIAGIIGRSKFIYDLWGDTVNVASRMESHGLPGKTQVSTTTHDLLRGRFIFEERGRVEIRGKGPMTTYFLICQK